MNWKIYSYVIRGKYRKSILLALNFERIPSQIAKITKINISHVSRALSELRKRDIVECVNPEENFGRIYRLTKKGNELRNHIQKAESN